jgi:hypothetical protein
MLAMQAVMRADHAKSSSLTDAKTTPPITCVCVCVCVFVCVCTARPHLRSPARESELSCDAGGGGYPTVGGCTTDGYNTVCLHYFGMMLWDYIYV